MVEMSKQSLEKPGVGHRGVWRVACSIRMSPRSWSRSRSNHSILTGRSIEAIDLGNATDRRQVGIAIENPNGN